MMRRRGFTLVEIVLTVFFIGIITISIFPLFFSEAKKLRSSFSFTEAGFEAQTLVEAEVKRLVDIAYDPNAPEATRDERAIKEGKKKDLESWSDDASSLSINLFGSSKPLEVLSKTVSTGEKDIGTNTPYQRNLLVLMPKSKGQVGSGISIEVSLTGSGNSYTGNVSFGKKSGGDTWEEETQFCVYRWYIGDYKTDYTLTDLTLVREYNVAKNKGKARDFDKLQHTHQMLKPLSHNQDVMYKGGTYKVLADGPYFSLDANVPLIQAGVKTNQKAGDTFKLDELNMDNKEQNKFIPAEVSTFYEGKGLVFSAMPVLKSGEVGKETFSEMKKLNVPDQKLRLSVFPTYKVISALSPYPGDFRVSFLFGKLDKKYPDVDYFLKVQDLTRRKEYKLVYKRLALAYVYDSVGASMIKLDFHSDGNSTWDIFMYKKTDYEISVIQRTKDASGNYVENVIMSGKIKLPDK